MSKPQRDAHPADDQLLDLAHRLLPAAEESAVLVHLAACAPCEERFRVCAGARLFDTPSFPGLATERGVESADAGR